MNPERGELVVVKDAATLASTLAGRFVAAAEAANERHGRFDVALAGGSTPKAAYELLSAAPLRERVAWGRVRFFFGDERCVPPDDDESNYKMAQTAFGPVFSDCGATVFRMRGEGDPQFAARAYAGILREALGTNPAFDLIMLGLGPDGHTASLFPGSDPFSDDGLLVRAPFVTKFDSFRLTLTPRVLGGAHKIVVAISGDAKAPALHAVLDGPRQPTLYPAQALWPHAGSLMWLADHAAAALLD